MEQVLVVSASDWMRDAIELLDRVRFEASDADYSTALKVWRETAQGTVIIGAQRDLGAAAMLVRELWRQGKRRPVIILVGLSSQRRNLQKHAMLRERADGYVTEDAPPSDLVAIVERPRVTAEQLPNPWFPALVAALVLIVFVAPAIESWGHPSFARWCAAAGALLGIGSEALAKRRGRATRPLLVAGFIVVLVVIVVLRFAF